MTRDKNKHLVYKYFKAYETGDIEVIMSFVHPLHQYNPPGGDKAKGFNARQQEDTIFLSAFSEIKVNILDQIAEGAKVVSRVEMTCLHSGIYGNFAPTNKQIKITFIDISYIKEEKICEEWNEFDYKHIFDQLSV